MAQQRANVRLDFRAIKRLMGRSPNLAQYMARRMDAAKAFAESRSPDAAPYGTGYIRSFQVEHDRFPDGVPLSRLVNTDIKWAVVEYGSAAPRPQGGSSPPNHVFAQTLAFLEGSA